MSPWTSSIFWFYRPQCCFMARQVSKSNPTYSSGSQGFTALNQDLIIHFLLSHWPIIIPSVASGQMPSNTHLYFLRYGCKVGIQSKAGSASSMWLPVWILDASFWHLAFHVVFILISVSAASPFRFLCKHSQEGRILLASPQIISLTIPYWHPERTTTESYLNHCTQATKLVWVSTVTWFLAEQV